MARQSGIITDQAQLSAKPTAPASGYSQVYPKTDGKWYYQNSDGAEFAFTNWKVKAKTADQSKANDTTLANDDTLFFSMAASTKYSIRIRVYGVAPATPSFKYLIVGPASPTLVLIETALRAPAGTTFTVAGTTASAFPGAATVITGNATSHFYLELDIIVQNGANAGTFAFQWAQNATSTPNPCLVRAGSYLEYLVL